MADYTPDPALVMVIAGAWNASEYADLIPLEFMVPLAEIAVAALATEGRLLPPETEVRTEWGVWWHSGDSDGIVLSAERISFREDAEHRGEERIGEYGITRYTLRRCEHRKFADGSTLVGPWLPAPTDTKEN